MEDLPNLEFLDSVPQQNPELGQQALADESDSAKKLARQAKRWGTVNAALCGLLVVAFVASVLLGLGVLEAGGSGQGIFAAAMLIFFIPIACIPIGISCLVGALRARAVLRRHPSREARLGLRLSVGGPIAVILCYVLGFGVPIGIDLLHLILLSKSEPHMTVHEVRLTDGGGQNPTWSPDGSRIAFVGYGDDNKAHIYLMDADGANVVRLTDDLTLPSTPAWSPDGSRIAYSSYREGVYDIYTLEFEE